MPLMNIKGRRTKFNAMVTSPGFSVGMEANIIPSAAKQADERKSPINKKRKLVTLIPKTKRPMMIGIIPTSRLYVMPAIIFPTSMEQKDMGATSNLSKVFSLLSKGIENGPIEEELNKMIMAVKPGIRASPISM